MYKELIIAIIIVIGLITIDINLQKYTDTAVNGTIESLSDLEQKLKEDTQQNQELISKSDEIYENWLKYYKKLAYFIEHDELEKVESDFTVAKSYIKTNQYNFAVAKLEETIFILQHINDKYAFNLENIF